MNKPLMLLALLALLLPSAAALGQGASVVTPGEPMYALLSRAPIIALCVVTEGNDVAAAENGNEDGKPPLRYRTASCKAVQALAGAKEGDEFELDIRPSGPGGAPWLTLKKDEKWLLFLRAWQGKHQVTRAAKVVDDKVTDFQIRKSAYGILSVGDGEMSLQEALAGMAKAIGDHARAVEYDTDPGAKTDAQLLADIGDNDELNLKIVDALNKRRACPQLLTLLKRPPPGLTLHATVIRALGQCPGEATEDALIGLLNSKDPLIFNNAADVLAELKSTRALEPLIEMANKADGALSYPVMRALAATGDARALAPLLAARERAIEAENDPASPVPVAMRRQVYLQLIRGFDDPRVLEVAKQDLKSDAYATVILAAEVLHEHGDSSGIDRLGAVLEADTSWPAQSAIIDALKRLKDPKAIPLLIKSLSSKTHAVPAHAAQALRLISVDMGKECVGCGEDAAKWQEWWDKHKQP